MSVAPSWVSVFLDVAPASWETLPAFWAAVSGTTLSPPRGAASEFRTLVPASGDDHLRVQRRGADDPGPTRLHLDLHVTDAGPAAATAVDLGAAVVHRSEHGYVVLRSPGGLTLCFVHHPASRRSAATTWTSSEGRRHRSQVDQACLDVPPDAYDAEVSFWAALTGWETRASTTLPCFTSLVRPEGQPVRLLLQRLDEAAPGASATAHPDLATDDRPAEVARHVALGARVLAEHPWWTVLAVPDGLAYCVTDRAPLPSPA
ncbi:VOC family protein [Nocardioides bruguierae]|uniref:VOC family protein n=1 Tax=Nocardioides bruguierae TaxID=2945102 RepID=A0A9X2D683_9ACTN|nr:VOC family protein [Nocardioides bruguierae]MCM0620010.1 VOC family protein [Nocardioides bruguierae]